MVAPTVTVVIPTIGRPSLHALLQRLSPAQGPVVVVDDRRDGAALDLQRYGVQVLRSHGRGPAAARNVGWRHAGTPWVAFLDDDVHPEPGWWHTLVADLRDLPPDVAGSQGRIRVPLPAHRRPTDWERHTAGLARAPWITADLAYRRAALAAVGGFDERFSRAYREDSDLALRVRSLPARLVRGDRVCEHPVRPAGSWVSVGLQRGNADDVLMRRLHGPDWRERAGAAPGRRPRHLGIVAATVGAMATRRRPVVALGLGALAGAGVLELAASRIAAGPRTARETATMLATSLAIPFAAATHTVAGLARHHRVRPWRGLPEAVLFDRDGTLVVDVPYNGDPDRVTVMPQARETCDRFRAAGVQLGVVSNQSGVARGLLTAEDVTAVNARVSALLGEFGTWQSCPHGPDEGCACRKPAPGMVLRACERLAVAPERCVVIGDIGADVQAALAAGAGAVLVPTPRTLRTEVARAPHVATDLRAAADLVLGGVW